MILSQWRRQLRLLRLFSSGSGNSGKDPVTPRKLFQFEIKIGKRKPASDEGGDKGDKGENEPNEVSEREVN